MEAGFAPGGDPVRRRKPVPKPSPDVNTHQEWVANPAQRRSTSTSSASSNPATQGVARPASHYAPLPTNKDQYRQNEATTYHGYSEHTGDAGNMTYHENDVQAGQRIIKAPDQKVKRNSKKIATPPAQDHQYTTGYGDGIDNTHQQQYNFINTGQARYDAHPYEQAYDQTARTTGGYNHAYGVTAENYAYGYGQGAEFIGTDDAYQHREYNEAGELNSNEVFYHVGGDQYYGGAHHQQHGTNSETLYGDASAQGDYDQQPGVVAEQKKKKKKKKQPKDGLSSHDELLQVDGNVHSEWTQYNQQPSDAATLYAYGAEQGYGDSQQAGVEELGNEVVTALDHNADQTKKKKKKKPKGQLQQVDRNAHLESPRHNQPNDADDAYSYGAEQGYGDYQQAAVEESGSGAVAAAPLEYHTADQRKLKNKYKNPKPKDGSTPSSHLHSDQAMIRDGYNSSRSEGSHRESGHHDRSNAPPRLDPLAEHIRKTSGPNPSFQDVSMVVFDPQDQSTTSVDPVRLTRESPRSRNPNPKPAKTQHGSSTKNMSEDDLRVFRDPLDEYLKQNQGNFSELPGESMVVFDPQDKSVTDLPGAYNHRPPGPPNYNQLPAGHYNSNTRPRRVMSQQPTYHHHQQQQQQHQQMIIRRRQQPQAVWGSPPHQHRDHPVDNIAQGGHQSEAVQAGQPNEKVMKCVHTVAVPCATIATRIAMRQCVNGTCCCTIL